jgi:hypothetical protein
MLHCTRSWVLISGCNVQVSPRVSYGVKGAQAWTDIFQVLPVQKPSCNVASSNFHEYSTVHTEIHMTSSYFH